MEIKIGDRVRIKSDTKSIELMKRLSTANFSVIAGKTFKVHSIAKLESTNIEKFGEVCFRVLPLGTSNLIPGKCAAKPRKIIL